MNYVLQGSRGGMCQVKDGCWYDQLTYY